MVRSLVRMPLLGSSLMVSLLVGSGEPTVAQQVQRGRGYDQLVQLFNEWREFQRPPFVQSVPDYSTSAMAEQHRRLPEFRRRLTALDTTGWTRAERVDWHVVRAEMNGLDFDHRVLRPWANNPAFYVTVFASQSDQPAREGPHAYGSLELWSYAFPLSTSARREILAGLRMIPPLLEQARTNLVGNGKDLWTMGVRTLRSQSDVLAALATRARQDHDLTSAVNRARDATDAFVAWLERGAATKTGTSGIGIENYNWYLANVQLVPYTWHDQVTLMQRELQRALAALALEEHRNRSLPPHALINDSASWQRRFDDAVTEYMTFLRDADVVSIRDYMEPALRARRGRFSAEEREFFTHVNHRDPIVMRTHDFHWIDLAQLEHDPHASPIRRGPLLYNIFITRTEGLATTLEEMLTTAGLIDAHARSRELIYILIAQRAARAIGDLMMHANRFTLEEAARFTSTHTPRGWLSLEGRTVWGEQHLYLQQPAYGTSYLIGKMQIEELLSERRRQLGEAFTLRQFMDELTAAGMIPMSLIRLELLGQSS